jgi:ribokinase
MPHIVVVGSINMDLVIRTAKIPMPGETVLGKDLQTFPGGKGANQAVALARLGAQVTMVGKVGEDTFGSELVANLEREGIDITHVRMQGGVSSGIALITLDASGQNSIVVAQGANMHLMPEEVVEVWGLIQDVDSVLVQLEIPLETVQTAVRLGKDRGARVILNPAPAPTEPLSPRIYEAVDILTPNESEAKSLTGSSDLEGAAQRMLEWGVKGVVITCGDSGVLVAGRDRPIENYPAFEVEVVDTVAAGDAFAGGLGVALAEGMSMGEALQFAQAAAALSVTRRGAQPSLPTRQEVLQFLSESA